MVSNSLKERVEAEIGLQKPEEVIELILDNSKAKEIEGVTDEFVNLVNLSLINVGLETFNNFPNLTSLRRLDLSDNNLGDDCKLECLVKSCPNLERVSLTGNKFNNFDTLKPFNDCEGLVTVDLFGCPISDQADYREHMFQILPKLKFLDGYDQEDNEEEIEESEDGEGESGDEDGEEEEGDNDESGEDEEEYYEEESSNQESAQAWTQEQLAAANNTNNNVNGLMMNGNAHQFNGNGQQVGVNDQSGGEDDSDEEYYEEGESGEDGESNEGEENADGDEDDLEYCEDGYGDIEEASNDAQPNATPSQQSTDLKRKRAAQNPDDGSSNDATEAKNPRNV